LGVKTVQTGVKHQSPAGTESVDDTTASVKEESPAKDGAPLNEAPSETALSSSAVDTETAKDAHSAITTTNTSSTELKSDAKEDSKDPDAKKLKGWPTRSPFWAYDRELDKDQRDKKVYWSELSWDEKKAYRASFLKEYLAETRKSLPYARKLLLMIFRMSPWRACVIFAVNIVRSLLPALTLQTRGSFILMVDTSDQTDHSCKKELKREVSTNENCPT
jgi:hypothetical protein